MPITASPPPDLQPSPYAPAAPEPLVMEQFQGINTSTTRAGVADAQVYWMDGFFPIAPRNLRALPGIGPAVYTSSGPTVVCFYFFNIGSTPYMCVFLSDGSVVVVNTSTTAATTILAPGTIAAPSILNVGISQWAQQYLIIVANQTNGYWLWDGTLIYASGTLSPVVTVTNGGAGYYTQPNISVIGGQGGGVVASAVIVSGVITAISLVNPGTGYRVGNTPTVVISGGTQSGVGGSINATLVYSGSSAVAGHIFSVSTVGVVAGGSNYVNPVLAFDVPSSVAVGAQAVFYAVVSTPLPGSLIGINLVNSGIYYAPGTGPNIPNTVVITDSASQASASVQLMPFGVQGSAVESYQGRIWVAGGNEVDFTAPGSFSDFSTASGGGSFSSGDAFLRVNYVRLVNSNGFLFLIADSSMNYISGVQTSGSPPTTTFTNQNADPEVGTPFPASVLTNGRDILLANVIGVYRSRGAALDKISEALDGVWGSVPNFGNGQLSSAKAEIFSKKVWIILAPIIDPISGARTNKLFLWNDKIWFPASQDIALTFISSQEINSVLTAWGTDGTTIRRLFNTPSTGFVKTVQSKLWDAPGGYEFSKADSRLWSLWQYNTNNAPNITALLDAVGINPDGTTFTNTQPYTIVGPAQSGYFLTPPQAIGQQGVLLGMTWKTSEADVSLVSAKFSTDPRISYRG